MPFNLVSRSYWMRGFPILRISWFREIFNRLISMGIRSRFTVIVFMVSGYVFKISVFICINIGLALPYILTNVSFIASDFSLPRRLLANACQVKQAIVAPVVSATQSRNSTERCGVKDWWYSSVAP